MICIVVFVVASADNHINEVMFVGWVGYDGGGGGRWEV